MKKILIGFLRRGIASCGIGPVVLAILYLIVGKGKSGFTLTPQEVFVGVVSLTLLAFVAGGMNVIYQIERLPLMAAVFLHGMVLYLSYLATYLINGWLEGGTLPILVFTGIFVMGYLIIWGIIYAIMKKRTAQVNELLRNKQKRNDIA